MADQDFSAWLEREGGKLGLPKSAPIPTQPANFLDQVTYNPRGWGFLPPRQDSGITFDEYDQPYDASGRS